MLNWTGQSQQETLLIRHTARPETVPVGILSNMLAWFPVLLLGICHIVYASSCIVIISNDRLDWRIRAIFLEHFL